MTILSKTIRILASILLFCACAPVREKEEIALIANNPLGIVMKNKKMLTVDTPNAGLITYYTVSAKNVPPNKKFNLYAADVVNPSKPYLELVSDKEGCLRLAAEKDVLLQDYPICMIYQHPGQPVTIWLVSDDKSNATKTSFIPYPLETFARDGAEVSLTRLTPNASLALCKGKYFQKNEKLEISLCSKEKNISRSISCQNGDFSFELVPPDQNGCGELLTLVVKRQSGEQLTLSYAWGRESLNREHLLGNIAKCQNEDYDKIEESVVSYRSGKAEDNGLI